jgi:Tol biopolymer transport system component
MVGAFLVGGCSVLTGANDLRFEETGNVAPLDGSLVDMTAPDAPVSPLDGAVEASPGADAAVDADAALVVRCDLAKPFGTPVAVTGLEVIAAGPVNDFGCSLSPDERTIYFASDRPGGVGGFDLYTATRANTDASFSAVTSITSLNTVDDERHPSATADGLLLVFRRSAAGGGLGDISLASRLSSFVPFGNPTAIPSLSTAAEEADPFVTASGDSIYVTTVRSAQPSGIYIASRGAGLSYSVPTPVPGLAGVSDATPSADELTVFVASSAGGAGQNIQVATRSSKGAAFGAATDVSTLNSPSSDQPDWLSPDGCRLYLTSARTGPSRLYVAVRPL